MKKYHCNKCEKVVKTEKIKIAAKLNKLIENGAPSEQENPIKYGVKIWNGVHNLIRELLL